MKPNIVMQSTMLAVGTLALSTLAASSAQVAYTTGDLVLNVRDSSAGGGDFNLAVNLGPASYLTSLAGGTTVNLNVGGNAGTGFGLAVADLVSTFGADWATKSTLLWSVIGYSNTTSNIIFASSITNTRTRTINNAQNNFITGQVQGMLSQFDLSESLGADRNSADIKYQGTDFSSNAYSNVIFSNSGTVNNPYGYGGWGTGKIEAGVTNAAGNTSNFFQIAPGSGTVQRSGFFTLGTDGTLTYTAVPEPSSAALAALVGAGALATARRRRRKAD